MILIYLDDILIPSKTANDNLMSLKKLELKLDKYYLFYKRIKHLGLIFLFPLTSKGLNFWTIIFRLYIFQSLLIPNRYIRFLGFTNYLRRFIQNYNLVAIHLLGRILRSVLDKPILKLLGYLSRN